MCSYIAVFRARVIPPDITKLLHQKLTAERTGLIATLVDQKIMTLSTDARELVFFRLVDFVIECKFLNPNCHTTNGDSDESCQLGRCRCDYIFDMFGRFLRSEKWDFYCVKECHGTTAVSDDSGERPVEGDVVRRLRSLIAELNSCMEASFTILKGDILQERAQIGRAMACENAFLPDVTLQQLMNKGRVQYREILKQFEELETKLGIKRADSISCSTATRGNFTASTSGASRRRGSVNSTSSENVVTRSDNNTGSDSIRRTGQDESPGTDVESRSPKASLLPELFHVCATRLFPVDWARLRHAILGRLPFSQKEFSVLPNGVDILMELVNRSLIGEANLGFLRDLFYEIERVDLVHLVDCVEEGDMSLLASAPPYVVQSLTSGLLQEVQGLSIEESQPSSRTSGTNNLRATGGYHGLEATNEETADERRNASEENTGETGERSSPWVGNPEFACDHYDRYCDVQFVCCERFWPCHRCHNFESSCGRNKLRSRDIQNIKCRRCQTIQQFPKQTPNCAHCNLKLAEYHCALCQHLTGIQNHPFHCDKCGICRVHGDKSFHCDVCGVCLDVNLLGKHKCRAGSAHDSCCICLEDAFSGCQILPCSHKVHKDCAAIMLRSGITRCPICRQSFSR